MDRDTVRAYLQRLSGDGRAQINRLVTRWVSGQRLVKRYAAPQHAFAGATRPGTQRCWPKWTAPWARFQGRPAKAMASKQVTIK